MHYKKQILQLIGVAIFVFILSRVKLQQTINLLQHLKWPYLIPIPALSILYLMIKAWKWHYLLKQQDIKEFTIRQTFLMFNTGVFLSLLTPGKIGDFAKALFLKKRGYSIGKSLVTIVFDRLSDFVFICIIAFLGAIFLIPEARQYLLITLATAALAIVLVIILIFLKTSLKSFAKNWLGKILTIIVPTKFRQSLKVNSREFSADFRAFSKKTYLVTAVVMIANWLIYYLQIYLLNLCLGLTIPFLIIIGIASILSVSSLIPISPSGTNIGTRELILIFLFKTLNLGSQEIALAFSLLILSLVIIDGLIGLFSWLKMPLPVFGFRQKTKEVLS